MTDKELLELAAKAMKATRDPKFMNFETIDDTCICLELGCKRGAITSYWKPLTDDGDALRLAVKLDMAVSILKGITYVRWGAEIPEIIEIHCEDPYAATRRAIVRAAAEIGKGMK